MPLNLPCTGNILGFMEGELNIKSLALIAACALLLPAAPHAEAATGYEKTVSWWQNLSARARGQSSKLPR